MLSCRWPSCEERPHLARSSPSAGTGGWVILVWPGCGIGGCCWGVGWAPWGNPPPLGTLALWWAQKEEHCQPDACLLPTQESSPTDHASVSSPLQHYKHLSFSPGDPGHLHISVGPIQRHGAFFSQHWGCGSGPRCQDQVEGEKLPGCQGFSCGIWGDNSGAITVRSVSSLGGSEREALPGIP